MFIQVKQGSLEGSQQSFLSAWKKIGGWGCEDLFACSKQTPALVST